MGDSIPCRQPVVPGSAGFTLHSFSCLRPHTRLSSRWVETPWRPLEHARRSTISFATLASRSRWWSNWRPEGWRIAVVHGNGPQVGKALERNELARHRVEPLPLECSWREQPVGSVT